MCLSNVFYIDSNGQQQEVMRDVAQMEAHNNGFLLIGLLGEQKFVPGEVRTIDFVDKHSVVLGVNMAKHEKVSSVSF
jgi:predicted RNA-binding protein